MAESKTFAEAIKNRFQTGKDTSGGDEGVSGKDRNENYEGTAQQEEDKQKKTDSNKNEGERNKQEAQQQKKGEKQKEGKEEEQKTKQSDKDKKEEKVTSKKEEQDGKTVHVFEYQDDRDEEGKTGKEKDGQSWKESVSEPTQDQINKALNDKTQGKITSMEDLERFLSGDSSKSDQKTSQGEKPYANEVSEKFDQWVRNGNDPKEFLRYNTTDPQNISDQEMLLMKYKSESPDLNDREARILLESDYKLDPEDNEEKVVEREKVRLKRDANLQRTKFAEYKADLSKKFEKSTDQDNEKEKKNKQIEQQRQKWHQVVDQVTSDYQTFKTPVGENETTGDPIVFRNGITDKERKSVNRTIKNLPPQYILDKWGYKDQNGSTQINMEEMLDDVYFMENRKKLIGRISNVTKSAGYQEVISENRAGRKYTPGTPGTSGDDGDWRKSAARKMFN